MASAAMKNLALKIRENGAPASGTQPSVKARRAEMEQTAAPVQGDVSAVELTVGDMAAEWVTAPGADPARRLLYLHGGGLTLATILAARDRGLTLPNCAITLSAWTDLAFTGESVSTRTEADPMISVDSANTLPAYVGDGDVKDSLVSPYYADYAGLPPLLMQVGDAEVLLDDTTRVAEKAAAAGVEVTCEVEPEAFHVYQMFAAFFPEGKEAVARIGSFLKKHQ